MVRGILKAEGLLRLLSLVLMVLTACLVGLDTQTKLVVFSVEREANVKDLSALWVLTIVAAITSGYNVIHLCKCAVLAWLDKDPSGFNIWASWLCLLVDQGVAYTIFAATLAATQASLIAVVGVKSLQWTRVCNIYTRFCYQIGAGLLCSLSASLAMAILSPISAHHLFKTYYSKRRASMVRS